MPTLKELTHKVERITSGHRMCAGCPAPVIVKQILSATDDPVVAVNATGCLEVATTIYPYTAWQIPWMHNAFENAASTMSGVVTAYNALKKRGKIDKNIKFVAFGGDGGTYDIGLQALSGALERGDNFLYVCYDNGAYQNTGNQRSGSTPKYAATTTTPVGEVIKGKQQKRKDLTFIAAAHHIPYVATGSVWHWNDTQKKATKAFSYEGPKVIIMYSPCPFGWKVPSHLSMTDAKIAVDTCVWPLYEIENGVLHITYKPKNKLPIEEWLKLEGRFKHLFKPENKHLIAEIQKDVDEDWERLLALDGQKLF